MKKHLTIRNILIDLVCTGIALVIFALFHHVLPRQQQSLGIVIPRPSSPAEEGEGLALRGATGSDESGSGFFSWLLSSASAEDAETFTVRAKGGRKNGGGMVPNSKGGSALTEADDAEAEDETLEDGEALPMEEKFADMYTDEVVRTENSYTSPGVSITVTERTLAGENVTYYLADIYVKDVTSFQTALAKNTYGSGYREDITDMAAMTNALVAINGDYYGNTNEGVVIRNGVIYRANPTNCDVCVLYYDGTMKVMPGSSFTVEDAVNDGAWQAWTFGPALLDASGNALTSFNSTGRIISANPRTAIGYYEPGHYCMVVVDGRGRESDGMTLQELSQLFSDLGCTAAYNLDGGNSSIMVWNGDVINDPSGGGRASSDALLIAEAN